MPKSELNAKADPELVRQLEDASAVNEPITAVVRLRSNDPSQIVPPPDDTERITQEVLRRVGERVAGEHARHHVFKNLGYFVVSADGPFLRELIAQPEVATAIANVQPGSALITPVKKKAVPSSSSRAKTTRQAKRGKAHTSARKAASKYDK